MNMFNPNFQDALRNLQSNPEEFFRKAGVNVPAEMMNDPQAIVMHLLRTGQVRGPMAQRMMPLINNMNTIR